MSRLIVLALILLIVSEELTCQSVVEENEDGTEGSISFKTPDLSDEISNNPWMPSELKCDSCRAIAYQFFSKFKKFNEQHKNYKFNIPESEVLDIVETTCDVKTFENYGLIEKKKVNRLKGPGLDTENVPGIMQGGGRWPSRIAAMCDDFVGDLGDDVIYAQYKKQRSDVQKFTQWLCEGSGIRGHCANVGKTKQEL